MAATFVKSAFRPTDLPKSNRPQIALLGRSNVGKSSLINHLAGTKRLARTSSTPGLTAAINLYDFDGRYFLVDLPGYGYSKAARSRGKGFEQMLSDYLSQAEQLKLVLLIIDGRHGLQDSDRDVLKQLQANELPVVIVFNKVDKLSNSEATRSLCRTRDQHPTVTCLPHTSTSSQGLGELRDTIERAVREAAS